MATTSNGAFLSRSTRYWGTLFLLVLCVALSPNMAGPVQAQDMESEPTKPCTSCHTQEADAWQQSPHRLALDAGSGALCVDCHGDYVRGHPDDQAMPLRVDSTICQECHAETYGQWQRSTHASAEVQCISCHAVHSQQMRLTDDRLCTSCHQSSLDDSLHNAHWQTDATCTMCHMTVETHGEAIADAGPALAAMLAPDHDFVTVSARNCLSCHRKDVTEKVSSSSPVHELRVAKDASEEQARQLAAKLQAAEADNWLLSIFSLANLGVGLGIGGMVGIALMVALARFGTRR